MRIHAMTLALAVGAMAGSASGTLQAQPRYDVSITRTTFNIPHIVSDSWQGIGYGTAYAYAQDNICMFAEEFVTISGERSLHFGPDTPTSLGLGQSTNLNSDFFFRSQIDLPALRKGWAKQSEETRALVEGYVAGYNRYLRDTGMDGLPEACRNKEWVRPITRDDMLRLNEKQMLLASSLALAAGIATAAPPGSDVAAASLSFPRREDATYGSNGWAFGGDATADGRGMVIGNPHFPWEGPARFWQLHVTKPGEYDAMGVGIAGTPLVTLGFNKDIAWTHTVTAARHFTLFGLQLSPDDPTTYMLDGEPVKMEAREISVPMPDGAPPATRTLYTSRFGPLVTVPNSGVQWTGQFAFALKDANTGNQRAIDTWMRIGKAKTVGEIEATVSETLGIPWVNTIAADRDGNALHADVTSVPNVSAEFITGCSTPFTGLVVNLVTLLDGTRSRCDWGTSGDGELAGLMPASEQAVRTRRDYVTNSNDSYWISNPRDPYRQLSPILGQHEKALTLRSRSNFIETEATLAKGKMDHATAQALVFGNKSLAADLVVEPLLAMCEGSNSLAEPCAVLAAWDRKVENDSRGTYLFVTFWRKVMRRGDLWSVPFDAGDLVNTPRGLKSAGGTKEGLLEALGKAAEELAEQGIALDAPWGEVQTRRDGDDTIAIHGGPGTAGILNMQRSRKVEGGITPFHGSSYIQIVGFDESGPVADAILSYSQSTDPTSPHYADQTRSYSAKKWHRLPFSAEQIEAEKTGETLRLVE